jgi:hypothetical protein
MLPELHETYGVEARLAASDVTASCLSHRALFVGHYIFYHYQKERDRQVHIF